MEKEVISAIITALSTLVGVFLSFKLSSSAEFKRARLEKSLMLIEKRDLEEAKQLEIATVEFVSSVERFVRIRLYTIAKSQELEFMQYSDLMNQVETAYSKLTFLIDAKQYPEIAVEIRRVKDQVIQQTVILDLRLQLDALCDSVRLIKHEKLKDYHNLLRG